MKKWKEELSYWEKALEKHPYVGGDEFTVADIALYVQLAGFERTGKKWGEDTEFPHVGKWYLNINSRPSAKATIPPHWKTSEGTKLF